MEEKMYTSELHLTFCRGKYIVLDIETSRVFSVDDLVYDILAVADGKTESEIISCCSPKHGESDIKTALDELRKVKLLAPEPPVIPTYIPKYSTEFEMQNIDLILSQDCNMRCRYCFAGHGAYRGDRTLMTADVARKAIDFLVTRSKTTERLGVTFFGGEPLLNVPVMKQTVDYCRQKEAEGKKKFRLSISTNATLLTSELVGFLERHSVHVQISIDGDKESQNKNRPYIGNRGTYDDVIANAKRYMRMTHKQTQARLTFTAWSASKLSQNMNHVLGLGFHSVHIEPASGKQGKVFIRTPEHLAVLKEQSDKIAEEFLSSLQARRFIGYHNIIRVLASLNTNNKSYYSCGAGRGYVCINPAGDIYPCHRFTGNKKYFMGNIVTGEYRTEMERFLTEEIAIPSRPTCKGCWARYLCGGDCYAAAEECNDDIKVPDAIKCELNKHDLEWALAIYAHISKTEKPEIEKLFGLSRLATPALNQTQQEHQDIAPSPHST